MRRRHRLRRLPSVLPRRLHRKRLFRFSIRTPKVLKVFNAGTSLSRRVRLSPIKLQAIAVPPKPPKSRLSTFFKSPISLSGCQKKKARDNRARRVSFFKSGSGGSRPPHKRNYNKEC